MGFIENYFALIIKKSKNIFVISKKCLFLCMQNDKTMNNVQNKFRKLTQDEVKRSLKATHVVTHLWLYSKTNTSQRAHNNSIFLTRTIGEPIGVIITPYNSDMCHQEIKEYFGNDIFVDGGVSPDDRDGIMFGYDCYYYKGA